MLILQTFARCGACAKLTATCLSVAQILMLKKVFFVFVLFFPPKYGFSYGFCPPPTPHFPSLYFCAVTLSLWDQVSQHTQSTVNINEGWVRHSVCMCVCKCGVVKRIDLVYEWWVRMKVDSETENQLKMNTRYFRLAFAHRMRVNLHETLRRRSHNRSDTGVSLLNESVSLSCFRLHPSTSATASHRIYKLTW